MKIQLRKKTLTILSVVLALFATLLFFIFSSKSENSLLYSECFSGGKLPTGMVEVTKNPRVAQKGQSGYLTSGPYVTMNPGSYTASLNYSAEFEEPNLNVGFVDRASDLLTIPGTENALIPKEPGDNEFIVSFEVISKLVGFEFRVFTNGKSKLEVKELCIKQSK